MRLTIHVLVYSAIVLLAQSALAQEASSSGAAKDKPAASSATTRKVDVDEFEKLWKDKENVVLDVRTRKEFAAGHIPGAVNVDVKSSDFEQQISKLKKDQRYLVHCGAGARSAKACEVMSRAGFTNLIDLGPGFKAWEKAGKPVEK